MQTYKLVFTDDVIGPVVIAIQILAPTVTVREFHFEPKLCAHLKAGSIHELFRAFNHQALRKLLIRGRADVN